MINPPSQLGIDFKSQGFPAGSLVSNGLDVLNTTWDDLLWAAVTVGRPNRQYVFRHGDSSKYEALFRWSLTRMALEQRGPTGFRLRRTDAAKTLDPTEKGAVNYFLGMTVAKLFSARLLNAPWVLHLDVFRPQLNPVLRGRSRPDLIGQIHGTNEWIALEAKGRISAPDANARTKAKQQAQQVRSVNGTAPSFYVGAITYFLNDVLQFFWRDPEPEPYGQAEGIELACGEEIWRYYYSPLLGMVRSRSDPFGEMLVAPSMMSLDELDIKVGVHPVILSALVEGRWEYARQVSVEKENELRQSGYHQDGVKVVAGQSWSYPQEVQQE